MVLCLTLLAKGTEAVARAVADADCTLSSAAAIPAAAVGHQSHLADKMSYSLAAALSMELVEGKAPSRSGGASRCVIV